MEFEKEDFCHKWEIIKSDLAKKYLQNALKDYRKKKQEVLERTNLPTFLT
jgi:hypothetical protein